ncbi:MAG: energy-coupling factor ABC transporter ATP-binding protein [Candidatus Baldrarchaeia archaeon]
MSLIKIKNLSFTYANAEEPAIKNINLTIDEGEFVLLTGPSGCGKTTLCRCLNGLIPHFYTGEMQGDVIIDGLNTREHPVYELAQKVGLVFQDPENQLVSLNVEKELAFAPENLGLPREEIRKRVEEALQLLKIEHLRYKAPYELSGGEQQRVAIASVLTLKPKILVLDEPTSNLDPKGAEQVLKTIKDLNEKLNVTIILIEHRLDLILPYTTRVILMNRGEIVLDSSPEKAFCSNIPEKIGVDIPVSIKLYNELSKTGVKFNKVPLCAKDAAKLLAEVLK